MAVLLLSDVAGGALSVDATAKAGGPAAALGPVTVLVCGPDAAADQEATINGVTKVLVANDVAYANGLAQTIGRLIVSLADDFSHIAAPATANSKNILPRVAAFLDVMIISAVVDVVPADATKVITSRTSTLDAAEMTGAAPFAPITGTGDADLSAHVSDAVAQNDRPDLTSAKIVVSGGRGVGSEETFELISSMAKKLGATVDADFVANDLQVGQTGKVVAPDMYIAVGISGAIQHLAGMKDSKIIVALN